MSFSSNAFIFFFLPISVLISLLVQKINRTLYKLSLIAFSIVFYAWDNYRIAILLFILCGFLWLTGYFIKKTENHAISILSVIILIALLLYFKYFDYIVSVINRVLNADLNRFYLTIPLGLSFIFFEAISYILDVSRGSDRGGIIDLYLYMLFFPKIASGPIVLWRDFLKQVDSPITTIEKLSNGIEKFIVGLGKKVIIADMLGSLVSSVTADYQSVSSLTLLLTVFVYAMELYYDFSGYSDMAIGLSRIFGFDFDENFNFPYLSKSISEFWRRWHISLGNFLKEYVYIPLGGSRKGNVYFNLFAVFFISGIWHGNSISYIVWGTAIGLAMVLDRYLMKKGISERIPSFLRWSITFVFVSFTWILFMMPSLSDSLNYLKRIMMLVSDEKVVFTWRYYFNNLQIFILMFSFIGALYNVKGTYEKIVSSDNKLFLIIRYILIILIFMISFVFLANSSFSPFIYFRF